MMNTSKSLAGLFTLALTLAAVSNGSAWAQSNQNPNAHHPDPGQMQTAPATPAPQGGKMPGMEGQSMQPGMMGGDMGRMMTMMMSGDMGRMMEMMRGRMAAQTAMRSLQHVEGQLAYYRTELGITDAQQPQWNAFADAVRASAQKLRQTYGQAMQQEAGQSATVPAQLERQIATLSVLLETTQAVAAAAKPLYAALSDEQKRTADELLAEHLHDMRARGL
jgi:hypothetical protein